ncbi:hypothetical protein V8B97DRAFT_2003786 [Scleroderma yunnanense]
MRVFKCWFSLLALAALAFATQQLSELQIETTYSPETCIEKANPGDQVKVHYTGTLFSTGEKFDSRSVVLIPRIHVWNNVLTAMTVANPSISNVIKGWDEGIKGMCVSEKRTLTIPSRMAYGSRGAGRSIPPNAALVFDVELVGLQQSKHKEL